MEEVILKKIRRIRKHQKCMMKKGLCLKIPQIRLTWKMKMIRIFSWTSVVINKKKKPNYSLNKFQEIYCCPSMKWLRENVWT